MGIQRRIPNGDNNESFSQYDDYKKVQPDNQTIAKAQALAAKEVKRARGLKRRNDIEQLLQNAMLEGTIAKKEYVTLVSL